MSDQPTVVVVGGESSPEDSPAVEALQDTVEQLADTVSDLADKVGDGTPASLQEPTGDETALAVTVGALVEKVDGLCSKVEGLESALAAALEDPEPEPEPVPAELPPPPPEEPEPPTFGDRIAGAFKWLVDG